MHGVGNRLDEIPKQAEAQEDDQNDGKNHPAVASAGPRGLRGNDDGRRRRRRRRAWRRK
jgi:hypothetical protein